MKHFTRVDETLIDNLQLETVLEMVLNTVLDTVLETLETANGRDATFSMDGLDHVVERYNR